MASTRLHLSQLLRASLVDTNGDAVGRVRDVIARLGDDGLPVITGLVAGIGGRELFVPIDRLADLNSGMIALSRNKLDLRAFERRVGEVLLRLDVVGHQLIDVAQARLITAHDIELTQVDGRWQVAGVLIDRRSSWRRLINAPEGHRSDEELVSWEQVEPFVGHVPTARLKLGTRRLRRLHPAQIADLVEAASHEQGEEIIGAVAGDSALEADVFEELDDEHQAEFVADRSDVQLAALVARMATDDAADLIADLPQERRLPVLEQLPAAQGRQVKALLGYNPRTAGGLMSPEFVTVQASAEAKDAFLAAQASDCPEEALGSVLLVDEDGRLVGALSAAALLRTTPPTPLRQMSEGETPAVRPDAELDEIASLMSDYNLIALPVIDAENRPIGLVTVDDVLELTIPRDWRTRQRATHG